ncbi:polyprenyl synthetase family protein [Bacillus sp. 1P06AnD]|uniref:polyprenyl synthetase family protein n=1 Tax=Bacillus sp. 1P06AnD TaxID=3132208 RepID=UPI0039A3DBF0
MNTNADESYRLAERKAAGYFEALYGQAAEKSYIPLLKKDIQSWKSNHVRRWTLFSFFLRDRRKKKQNDYHQYIKWMHYTGKLDHYLERSISYIFMRDLGKALDEPDTKKRIRRVVGGLKKQLIESAENQKEIYSLAELYRWAQKEGIENSLIWVMDKLKDVLFHIPEGMDADQAQRKLIKLIGGVLMHVMEEMEDGTDPEVRSAKLDEAIRLGYSYGLTYPFIDDLLDAKILSADEEKQYSRMIRTSITTGSVPVWKGWDGKNSELMRYVHSELQEAFDYIKQQQHPERRQHFLEQSYVFFQAQEVDRSKNLACARYSNEDLYIPVILKSSSSRLIVRSVIGADEDEGFDSRTFYYGIYNQLADDFADMFNDMEEGAVTPYTYYLKYGGQRPDLLNPYELYWTVISHLIHFVYHADPLVCEVILDRAINGLKRFKERIGTDKYNEVMDTFAKGDPAFNRMIQELVQNAEDVDFYDKLLRDHMLLQLRKEREEREAFQHTIEIVRKEIDQFLLMNEEESISTLDEPIIEAANYSLKGGGKRLRPIIAWVMGIEGYGIEKTELIPLLKSLEYMHTASLIFDDLPSQDNAPTRRGNPTLHEVYNTAIAEITGLFLTQKAVEEQASIHQFDPKAVLRLIRYSSQKAMEMCQGQAMDLEAKGKRLSLGQLNAMCFYKTGIAFEAALLMPAILAGAEDSELEALKQFAQHAGIAFQIKDDLLDVEGNGDILGKPVGQDAENHKSTFVSVLGREAARKEMWKQYCLAMESLEQVPRNTSFLKHLMDYIVNRKY